MSQLLIAKTLHVFFVISWFAGIFYLPRLFVNHAMARDDCEHRLLSGMEGRLIRMMNFTAAFVILTGTWLLYLQSSGFDPAWFKQQGWFHAKITLVLALLAYHYWSIRIHRQFVAGRQNRSHVWFRWFNEMPVFALLAILYLVLAKPF